MTEIVVGRAGDASVVGVGSEFRNVSRRHLALTPVDGRSCRVVDLDSSNGTEALVEGKWRKIDKAVVATDQRLRLGGEYETSGRDLLALAERQGKFSPQKASVACPICGGPVSGSYCPSCQTHIDLDARGFVGLMAQDMLGLGEKASYAPYIGRLVTSPVKASVALARDPSFRLHGAFFALSSALYVGMLKFSNVETTAAEANLVEKMLSIFGLNATAVLFYIYFIFGFVITYYVFKDYSRKPKSPRGYLKLCCVNSLVNTCALLATILVIAVVDSSLLSYNAKVRLDLLILMIFVAFVMQYYVRTNMEFWSMSAVSTFRGLVISYALAVILMIIIFMCVGVIVYFVTGQNLFETTPASTQ